MKSATLARAENTTETIYESRMVDGVWCYGDYGPMVNYTNHMLLYGDACPACQRLAESDWDTPCAIRIRDNHAATVFDSVHILYAHARWGLGAKALYRSTQRLGLERVVDTIREIRPKTGLGNPGAYLNRILRNMIPGTN